MADVSRSALSPQEVANLTGQPNVQEQHYRVVVALARQEEIPPEIIRYLNRLSDAFFVWSRWVSQRLDVPEVLWEPNQAASALRSK